MKTVYFPQELFFQVSTNATAPWAASWPESSLLASLDPQVRFLDLWSPQGEQDGLSDGVLVWPRLPSGTGVGGHDQQVSWPDQPRLSLLLRAAWAVVPSWPAPGCQDRHWHLRGTQVLEHGPDLCVYVE